VIVLLALGANALSQSAIDRVIGYRVRSQNLHIDHLEHEVEKLEHAFSKLSRPITKWDVSMLTARVHKNEGKRWYKQCPVGLWAIIWTIGPHEHYLNLHYEDYKHVYHF